MIKNEVILSAIYMIQDYSKGSHFLEETVDRVLDELKLLDKELEALQQSKQCNTCRFYHSFTGVCANDNCPLCADFVDADFGCIYHEAKEQ